MKSKILLKRFSKLLSGCLILQSLLSPMHALAVVNQRANETTDEKTIQQLISLVTDIKSLHEKHKKMSLDQLRLSYDQKLYNASLQVTKKIETISEGDKRISKLKKLLNRINQERWDIREKSATEILENEVREIAYLEKKLQLSAESSEMKNPVYMFAAMFGVIFCCTVVLFPIGVSMIDWAFMNTTDLYWY